jgi:2-phosphosulfolactate phosphatase
MEDLTICHSPVQWRNLSRQLLEASACAVIDVIRATSTIASALASGAEGVRAVADVGDAFALKAKNPSALLAGERGGQALPGFDLGNSPEDFTPDRAGGRLVILTTTNGTQALAACTGARAVVTASFLNLSAAAACLRKLGPPWIVLCAGCEGAFGVDDAAVAGALAAELGQSSAWSALYQSVRRDLPAMLLGSAAGQELVRVGLARDIAYCAKLDALSIAPRLDADGIIRG